VHRFEEDFSLADEMIIASATSSRHAKALSDRVVEDLKSNNILVLGVEGQDTSDWILIDCEDLVINIMNNETRVYYDLETLWGYEDATLNSNL
jgi:iojap-like ribosome-associated protein